MKLTWDSENKGLDKLIELELFFVGCPGHNKGNDPANASLEFLVMMDNLEIEVAEDMLKGGVYED